MDILIVVFLLALGIFLIILEVFFLPGITIAGIGALFFLLGAIYYAFSQLGHVAGFIAVAVSVFGSIGGLLWFMRSKTLDRLSLKADIDAVVPSSVGEKIHPGDRGVTLSRLNPMGKVIIDGQTIDARSQDDFIDEETPVIVLAVERTTIVVRVLNKDE